MQPSSSQLSAIVDRACAICSVSPSEIYSRSRRFPVITTRNMLWLHLRHHYGFTINDIVRHFGFKRRNVQYACASITGNMRFDRTLADLYARFEEQMLSNQWIPDQ